jgi:hypothetical protein
MILGELGASNAQKLQWQLMDDEGEGELESSGGWRNGWLMVTRAWRLVCSLASLLSFL